MCFFPPSLYYILDPVFLLVQKAAGTKDATRILDPVFLLVQKAAGTKDAVHNLGMSKIILVRDLMQTDYQYELSQPVGANFHEDFKPQLSPKEMLELGVFGGKYMTDCTNEFPKSWFTNAKLCHEFHDPKLNFFKVNASQPLAVWQQKGWIYKDDPRGWFQWYFRYFMGRRLQDGEDEKQIKRWRLFRRHLVQVERNCMPGDFSCRKVQRQALLHWAYDSRVI